MYIQSLSLSIKEPGMLHFAVNNLYKKANIYLNNTPIISVQKLKNKIIECN